MAEFQIAFFLTNCQRHRKMKAATFSIVLLALMRCALAAESDDHQTHKQIERTEKELSDANDPAELMYSIAANYAAQGRKDEAIVWLRRAVNCKEGFDPSDDNYFESVTNEPEFQHLVEDIHRVQTPVHRSTLAFSIAEKDLIPEGITYDPKGKAFYLGSLYKEKSSKSLWMAR